MFITSVVDPGNDLFRIRPRNLRVLVPDRILPKPMLFKHILKLVLKKYIIINLFKISTNILPFSISHCTGTTVQNPQA